MLAVLAHYVDCSPWHVLGVLIVLIAMPSLAAWSIRRSSPLAGRKHYKPKSK